MSVRQCQGVPLTVELANSESRSSSLSLVQGDATLQRLMEQVHKSDGGCCEPIFAIRLARTKALRDYLRLVLQ